MTATVVKNTFEVRFRLLISEDGRANSSQSVWYDILYQRLGRPRRFHSTLIAAHGHDGRLYHHRDGFAGDLWEVGTKTDAEL